MIGCVVELSINLCLNVQGGKVLPPSANPFLPLYGSGDLAQPPPAHMGISAVPFDAKRSKYPSMLIASHTSLYSLKIVLNKLVKKIRADQNHI